MNKIKTIFNLPIIILMFGCTSTAKIVDSPTPDNAVASIEYIELNGLRQCIMLRSYNVNNPVILFLHGGPGTSEMSLIRHYNSELEKHFTVIYWEQRGTGKSFNKKIFKSTLNIDQFVNDGYELTKYLLNRFQKEKIYIIGHSWGTIVSTMLVKKYPELYFAYIGIGQDVHPLKGEQIGYQFALQKAKESDNKKALNELTKINTPNYLTIKSNNNWYKQLKTQRKWLTYFGGVIYNETNYKNFSKIYLKSPEYSLLDMINFGRGSIASLKNLWPEIMEVNLLNDCSDFKIPVYFIQGKHDYNCPTELVIEYYNTITAPKKELYIYENSAHNPNFEENQKFNEFIIQLNDIIQAK